MPGRILNLGSINRDHVYRLPAIVAPGETLGSTAYDTFAGGKGLNQSVAASRAGAAVCHMGAVGRDGTDLVQQLAAEGINSSRVSVTDLPTGHALIQVDDQGENAIVLYPGANHRVVIDFSGFGPGDVFLTQNETNGVAEALRAARAAEMRVAFNPAPMSEAVTDYPLECVDLLIVNESEADALGDAVARVPGEVLLTLGSRGAVLRTKQGDVSVPAEPVVAADTTAAGDTFIGYFLAATLAGRDSVSALRRAAKAAAICVTRPGAMDAIPYARELDQA